MRKEDSVIKLSIITPYYKTREYTKRLSEVLLAQLNDNVEWIIIDDGTGDDLSFLDSNYVKLLRLPQNSGGASVPRNVGLDNAKGEYIAFIDSDDLVEKDYIDTILAKIDNEDFDYCYLGWDSNHFSVIIKDEPPEWNCSLWNCIYKKELIGEERFNPELVIGEDYDFNLRVRRGKKSTIERILYHYSDTPNSLMKRGSNNN